MLNNLISYTTTLLKSFTTNTQLYILPIILNFFAPVYVQIFAVLFFILVDLVLGYKLSRRIGRKEIQSNLLRDSWGKLEHAFLLIIGSMVIDRFIVTSFSLHLVEIVTALICCTEFISWLELMTTLNQKNSFIRVIKFIFGDIIKDKTKKYLGTEVDVEKLIKQQKKKTRCGK